MTYFQSGPFPSHRAVLEIAIWTLELKFSFQLLYAAIARERHKEKPFQTMHSVSPAWSGCHQSQRILLEKQMLRPLSQSCGLPRLPCKESACSAGDPGLIPGSGRSPGGGNSNPLQSSCLENSMDRGAWQATVHGVAKSWTRLND